MLFLVGKMLYENFSTPDAATPAPAVVTTQPARAGDSSSLFLRIPRPASSRTVPNLDPTLHPEWMAATESMTYSGTGRNIFSAQSAPVEVEKPKFNPRSQPVADLGPPPPPPPPPIELKFFGFSAVKTGVRKAFLLHGEDVFIANEGDGVVDQRDEF